MVGSKVGARGAAEVAGRAARALLLLGRAALVSVQAAGIANHIKWACLATRSSAPSAAHR